VVESELETKKQEMSQMEEDLKNLIEYKSEMEELMNSLKLKLEEKKAKEQYFKETLGYKE